MLSHNSCRVATSVLVATIGLVSSAAGEVRQAWVARYDGPAHDWDRTFSIKVDAARNVYVHGFSTGIGTYLDYATLKYAPNGTLLWERRYDGTGHGHDYGQSAAVDGLGNVVVTGASYGINTSFDVVTLKYDPDGKLLWEQRFVPDPIYDDTDAGADLALDGAGNIYVTGYSDGFGTDDDIILLKYAPDGALVWSRRYNGPGNGADWAFYCFLGADGNIYLGGVIDGAGSGWDYAFLKYDPDGNLLWVRQYNGPGNGDDYLSHMVLDAAGNSYANGFVVGAGGTDDYGTVKYDKNGTLLWAQTYDNVAHSTDYGRGVAVDGDGNVFASGQSYVGGTAGWEAVLLKYDPAGVLLWDRHYNGPLAGGDDGTFEVVADADGNAYVPGYLTNPAGDADYLILKYDPDGDVLWEQHYAGPGDGLDWIFAAVLDNARNLYVVGESEGVGTGLDFAAVKYSQFALGDLNCDGVINAFDIDPFVLALTDPAGYAAAWPTCDRTLADCNADGQIDAFDIDPFVELLTGN